MSLFEKFNYNKNIMFFFSLILLSILKCIVVNYFYDFGTIYNFGQVQIGSTVKSLHQSLNFIHCDDPRLIKCSNAKLMPFPPLTISLLATFFNNSLDLVLISKTIILDIILITHLYFFDKKFKLNIFSKLLIFLLFLSPQYMLHSFTAGQAEGFLIQLFPITFIVMAFIVYKIKFKLKINLHEYLYCILLINILVLTKFSLILIFIFYLGYLFYDLLLVKNKFTFSVILIVIAVLPLTFWGKLNYDRYGSFHLSSSENMISFFMGNNSYFTTLYPKYQVDWITSQASVLINNKKINLTDLENQIFNDEWERSNFFKQKTYNWILNNPREFIINIFYKFYAIYFEPRNFPIEDPEITYSEIYKDFKYIVGLIFMSLIKIFSLYIIFKFFIYEFKKFFLIQNIFIFFSAFLYISPYLLAFAYQRHLIPIFLIYFLANSLIGNKIFDKS